MKERKRGKEEREGRRRRKRHALSLTYQLVPQVLSFLDARQEEAAAQRDLFKKRAEEAEKLAALWERRARLAEDLARGGGGGN